MADIASWLKVKGNIHMLQNVIGNRLIYPQTIPVTKEDLQVDLAILREAIFRQPNKIYDQKGRILLIPEEFEKRFPPLVVLVTTIIECLNPSGITFVYLRSRQVNQMIGTIIAPQDIVKNRTISVIVNGKALTNLKPGSLTLFPYKDKQVRVKVDSDEEKLVSGGKLGVIIDLRKWT